MLQIEFINGKHPISKTWNSSFSLIRTENISFGYFVDHHNKSQKLTEPQRSNYSLYIMYELTNGLLNKTGKTRIIPAHKN